MAQGDTVSEAIDVNARGPKKVKRGENEIEYHSIQDQIAADEYADKKAGKTAAAGKAHFGLRFTKLIPPGGR